MSTEAASLDVDGWRSDDGRYAITIDPADSTRYIVLEGGNTLARRAMLVDALDPALAVEREIVFAFGFGDEDLPRGLGNEAFVAWAEHAMLIAEAERERRAAEHAEFLRTLPGRRARVLATQVAEEVEWLVPGMIAPRWAVKIAGREKLGKGTLIFYLLGCLERGEPTCFGPAYRNGETVTALILTEEPEESIREKVEAFGLTESRIIQGYELAGRTWPDKVRTLVRIAQAEKHAIVFCDNFSRSANIEDEAGVEAARAVEEFSDQVRAAGLTGIIDHHHRKTAGPAEDMSRGGTGIAGATDVNVEMLRSKGAPRKRRLVSRGRVRATIWEKTVELSEDGTEYSEAAPAPSDESMAAITAMRLSELPDRFTASQGAPYLGVSTRQAARKLDKIVDAGLLDSDPQGPGKPKYYSRVNPSGVDGEEPDTETP